MAKCYICGKAVRVGRQVSHSKRHTSRVWRPNLQWARLTNPDGTAVRAQVCTRCQRTLSKSASPA